MFSTAKRFLRMLGYLLTAVVVAIVCLLKWGADLLIADDPLPVHVDAAVVLEGSVAAEKARIAGAMQLLQQGVAERVILSVPKESYWGQSIPPVARAYLEKNYGSELAARVDFCETDANVDSTIEEARVLIPCIEDHQFQSLAVVTSNYHTRRAGLLWRRVTRQDRGIHLWVHAVIDPEFQSPWWRHRESAKIWLMESVKLTWSALGGS